MSKKYELTKADKYMIAQLYLKGFSKDDIYEVIKRNKIYIPRQQIRDYLKGSRIEGKKGKIGNYSERIKNLYEFAQKQHNKEAWKTYYKQKQGLQDNFLKSTAIRLYNDSKTNHRKIPSDYRKYKKFVKWNEYTQEWKSP